MSDAAKELLDRRIGALESASFWFGVILIAGLFAERFASKDLIIVPFNTRDGTSEYLASSAHPFIDIVSWCEIWIGALGETCSGIMLAVANRKRASADTIKIRDLELKIEESREENQRLKEQLAPRSLTQSQISALHDQAVVLFEHDLDIVVVGGAGETKDFAQLISWPFRVAKWNVRFWSALPEVNNRGITLYRTAHATLLTIQLASDLLAAFSIAQIPCVNGGFLSATDLPGTPMGERVQRPSTAEIRIYVGEKT